MDATFLFASQAIAKKYTLDSTKKLIVTPYPFVYEVSSAQYTLTTLKGFHNEILKAAKQGGCLLKGQLSRPLVNESRRGSTDPNAFTDWICLDLDGIEGYQTVDLFLEAIGCQNVDYILQWSSSMGIENKAGFRCHIIMLLATPVHPQLLKYWLQDLNLTVLDTQLSLTKTYNSLRWPLDITTCQNDKLIYIAPPILGKGVKDPFVGKERISFVKRKNARLTLPYPIPTRDTLRSRIDKKVQQLRADNNLPKRKAAKYKFSGTTEYLLNPDTATVTGMKEERDFVYFNLNGGDSWAYYHPKDNPTFIYNFKGEPTYRTADLLPDYWASYKPDTKGITYFAFRDFRTSNYFNGYYNPKENKLNIAMAKSETQLRQFMEQHGQSIGDCVPDWNLVWDPHSTSVIDMDKRELNTYQPSIYASHPYRPIAKEVPQVINKVISHVLRNDTATINWFLNWLACIVQFRTRTGTAWVWQGTQGTGKGVLFHQIITPLLGEQNVVSKRMEELESEFTGFMENKFVVFIDEIEAGKSLYHNKITAKLKNLIVEPTISVRKMYTPAYMATNFSSMIFASNKPAPVEIAPDDRRFNVGPYQETPIRITATEIDVDIPKELPAFFSFLMHFPADQNKARTPLINTARTTLINLSRTAIDMVSDALCNGDLRFLWDHLSTSKTQLMNGVQSMKYMPFRELVIGLVTTQDPKLTREELFIIFEWCVGEMPQSPHKFTALLKHHRLVLTQIWKNNRNVRGITVQWQVDPSWLAQAQKELTNGDV